MKNERILRIERGDGGVDGAGGMGDGSGIAYSSRR